MVSSLFSGVSGIQQFQQKLDVIGNNIANSNTLGYKTGRADFEDAFSQTLSGGTSQQYQVGSGVSTGAVQSLFQQGTLAATSNPTDIAIDGNGFFTVRDPVSDKTFVTRAGDFKLDSQGYLVTSNGGLRVQGFSDSGLGTRGDIQIDATGNPTGDTTAYKNFSVDPSGKITVLQASGASFVRGQILLQNFQDPGALIKEGGNLYSGIDNAGPLTDISEPDTNGLGTISGGHLEMSNVDLAGEFADLITTQRGFQASARIITTTDEMLQEVVNMKH
jgi:flagellar hook protein FlgE